MTSLLFVLHIVNHLKVGHFLLELLVLRLVPLVHPRAGLRNHVIIIFKVIQSSAKRHIGLIISRCGVILRRLLFYLRQ